jgi:hypothetical protein
MTAALLKLQKTSKRYPPKAKGWRELASAYLGLLSQIFITFEQSEASMVAVRKHQASHPAHSRAKTFSAICNHIAPTTPIASLFANVSRIHFHEIQKNHSLFKRFYHAQSILKLPGPSTKRTLVLTLLGEWSFG